MNKKQVSSQRLAEQYSMETDYSDPGGDDYDALSRDRVPVRSLKASDAEAIIKIDRKITAQDRRSYYQQKISQVLDETGVRVSLVAEIDNEVLGFIMARVDYGEFGQTSSEAVIDTLGVAPRARNRAIGQALVSQLLNNLSILRVDCVRTEVEWSNFGLNKFLHRCGFQPSQRLAFSLAIE